MNVLLLEAGPADRDEAFIQIPFFTGEGVGTTYDWKLESVPQTYLDGQTRAIPQGRALGGGTVINGMLWNRGNVGDYEDWVSLGNPGWGWDDMLPYFIKVVNRSATRARSLTDLIQSETFTPYYSDAIATLDGIGYNEDVHGTTGPVNVSFPKYTYSQTANLFEALNELDIPTAFDPGDGAHIGASFLPTDLHPDSQTRCDARNAYYDPYTSRPNLWVSTGQHVTRILFEGGASNVDISTTTPGNTTTGQGNSSVSAMFTNNINKTSDHENVVSAVDTASVVKRRSLVSQWKAKLKRFTRPGRRQDRDEPATSTGAILRAIGVEVSPMQLSSFPSCWLTRHLVVCRKLFNCAPERHGNPRGHHLCRSHTQPEADEDVWDRSCQRTADIRHPSPR